MLYEEFYCALGEMENRIKECQLDFLPIVPGNNAGQSPPSLVRVDGLCSCGNVRHLALGVTQLAKVTCGTIRRKLFKIGALVTISVRHIRFAMTSGCPPWPSTLSLTTLSKPYFIPAEGGRPNSTRSCRHASRAHAHQTRPTRTEHKLTGKEEALLIATGQMLWPHPPTAVCCDESPTKLIGEVRECIPAKPGQLERFDCEYRRNGTTNLFIFLDARKSRRKVKVTEQRTAKDFAHCMRDLTDIHFPS